jgi:peptidylamidoglycolate lyase
MSRGMRVERLAVAVLSAAALAGVASCVGAPPTAPAETPTPPAMVVGGDGRFGDYEAVAGWWKSAADHDEMWTWGEVSGVAVDTPNRIIVAVWGDRSADGTEREGSSNYLVVVDGDGNVVETWSQWDSTFNKPHQVYISPYDPERHVWVVERGGGRGVHMQVMKFTNDGSELVMRLGEPDHPTTREEARANPSPGPYTYGEPAVLAFLPDGSFLLGDGYWNTRIVKYDADGEYVTEWGEAGSGPGQFDLVHGLAVDQDRRVYVADRRNNRIQVFSEAGEFIDQWPDITDPVGIYIDEHHAAWVISASLHRVLKYTLDGELQHAWGAYGGPGGLTGGLFRPHQIDVDEEGNVYVASWSGGWLNKFVPKSDADPRNLMGTGLVLDR